ncbi:MAG: copper resistance protein NlpE [Treponema sp.]|jgi:uncharacterized lipoprotein NlpE involved in copper resistance|nr:copper resistance protein NlpE [Treponema sp.]
MKKNALVFVLLVPVLLALALGACRRKESVDVHNSRNSLDWEGRYTGTIPAASGPGIEVEITLGPADYEISYHYIDRDGDFAARGSFAWNDAGSVITLDTGEFPPHYKVGENTLTQLDMEGKAISGPLAKLYVLKKVP